MDKKVVVKIKDVIHTNHIYVYFLRGKKVFRGRPERYHLRKGGFSHFDKIKVFKRTIKRIYEVNPTCTPKTLEILKKHGVKVIKKIRIKGKLVKKIVG